MDERWQTICSNFDVHFHDVKRGFRTASIVGMLFAGSMSNCHAQSQNAVQATGRPLVQIHLRTYGYNPGMRGGHDHWSLAFVGNDELVLGWTTSDDWDAAQKKGYLTPAPSHLHAVVLNARTGQKEIARDWQASTFYANIHPVANENFLICTGKSIRLLSRDFDLVRELPLSRFGPCAENKFSPAGDLFSIDSGLENELKRSVMKVESFAPVATWSKEVRGVHFNDTSLVGNCVPNGALCSRKFDGSWSLFVFPGAAGKTGVLCFVGNSKLVLKTENGLLVTTTDGNLLFPIDIETNQRVGQTACSAGGQRFAVVQMKMRGVTNELLDMYAFPSDDKVIVYDILQQKAIYEREVKGSSPWPPFTQHRNRLAISSDGALLAILDNGDLSVYQLPVPNPQ
jgi:hypothetical protein